MTYLSGKAQKRKTYTRYAIFGVVFLVIIFLWPFVKKNFYTTLEPAVIGYGNTKQSFIVFPEFFTTYLTSHNNLVAKQKALEITIEDLENRLAEKDAKLRESFFWNDMATSTEDSIKKPPLVMYPLVQDITKLYSTVILSKGFKDGVIVGATVYMRGYQAVCIVKEVYAASSLCSLLTASNSVTEGVTSSSSINIALTGRGGYFLANVARDTPITVGEKVYLRSNQKMILGTVKQVMNNNQDTSWHIFIESAYNPVTSSIFYVQP